MSPPRKWKTVLDEATEDIGAHILDVAYALHTAVGPGLREQHYKMLLAHGLRNRGLEVEAEVAFDAEFETLVIPRAMRADLLVDGRVVVEVKARETSLDYYEAQLLGYLLRANQPLGFLINFREPHLRQGIRRLVNSRAISSPDRVAP